MSINKMEALRSFGLLPKAFRPEPRLQYHRHLHEDEVLYIGSGIAHVKVGSLVGGDAHADAIGFIPGTFH